MRAVPALLLLPFLVQPAHAQQFPEGYAGGPLSGGVVIDSSGNCVRTGFWTPQHMTQGCGAPPKVQAVAAPPPPQPAPAPVVAPPPPPAPIAAPPPPPPAAPVVAAAPPPKPVTRSMDLRGDALFATNSAELRKEAQPQLDDLASKILAASSIGSIAIVGHTDSTGAAAYNQALSERRAGSVKDYLAKRGVDPAKISASGMGARQPIADNKTREGRAQNRRVGITITGTQ